MTYTFPFETCETPKKIIAQPYSSLLNLINCIIILSFLIKCKSSSNFILLLSILLFESFHLFSHIKHIKGSIQTNISHFLSYLINFSFLYFFYRRQESLPNKLFLIYLLVLVIFDIYALNKLPITFYIMSQAIIMVSILFYYYNKLPEKLKSSILTIVILITLIILFFLNEMLNCDKMLKKYPNFPFHIFIEIIGIFLFYIICKNFYK